ncbi:hypothetical protein SEA_MICRODON_58 [Streptomyces phage Microdon]|nr:hypothetical protein SEA_MICRODON_58 [Streptomyces phage Microdon]
MDQRGLTQYERQPFNLAGKPYIWVRVNGQLQTRSALRPDGRGLTDEAIARLAGE